MEKDPAIWRKGREVMNAGCSCHCHNNHENTAEAHCKCLPNCEHCNPEYHKQRQQKEVERMLRINACLKLGEHEYKVIKDSKTQTLSECIFCRNWLVEQNNV